MFVKSKISNMIIILSTIACVLLLGFIALYSNKPNQTTFAEGETPSYFSATVGNESYTNQSTVFLTNTQTLKISLGKPVDTSRLTPTNSALTKEEIGDFAVCYQNFESKAVSLNINGEHQVIDNYKTEIDRNGESYFPIKFNDYTFTASATSPKVNLAYFEMEIDLTARDSLNNFIWQSGEYVLSFKSYFVRTGDTFADTTETINSFTVTFYVFQEDEYFVDDLPKVTFDNVEQSSPNTISYRNYYYFNYSSLNSIGNISTQSLFPSLTFNTSRFNVIIEKSLNGTKSKATVGKDRITSGEYITLDETTTTNFITAISPEKDYVTIYFTDIGEYVIYYEFIYENDKVAMVKLDNPRIDTIHTRNDVLYIYGYQMFYSGSGQTANNEFKEINNGISLNSADITYIIPRPEQDADLRNNFIKSRNITPIENEKDNSDSTIKNLIKNKNIQPVSTNQPPINTITNANLQTAYSYYYTYNSNSKTWNSTKNSFNNSLFASSGTYLLKVVYTFDNYYTDEGISNDYFFVQYFYFTITTTNPQVIITDLETNQTLNTNAFTRNSVRVLLPKQSVFNSPLNAYIYSKTYSVDSFSTLNPNVLTASTSQDVYVDYLISDTNKTNNKNYYVKLVYGKNQNTYHDIYFTIDNNSFTGVKYVPVDPSISNSLFVKDTTFNYISPENDPINYSFFTKDSVVVEWDEKPSGASSSAYYKYIPFTTTTEEVKKVSWVNEFYGIPTTYQLNLEKNKIYDSIKYTKSNSTALVSGINVLSQPGLYIFNITDQAGNEYSLEFCIDNSPIQIWQYSYSTSDGVVYHQVYNYNVVSQNTYVEWGNYKLIKLNCTTSQINSDTAIADVSIRNTIKKLYSLNNKNDTNKIRSVGSSGDLYFYVKISNTYVLQEGNAFSFKTDGVKYKIVYENKIGEGDSEYKYAVELTYVFYLIDESNRYFNHITANNNKISEYIQNADKTYQITTSSDMSGANLLINANALSSTDVSNITKNSYNILQAGYADSHLKDTESGAYDSVVNLRTKYHFTTGSSNAGEVPIISYIINLNPSKDIYVTSVKLYYYEYIKSSSSVLTLSTVATETILYDITSSPTINLLKKLTSFTDANDTTINFYGYNLNTSYDASTNSIRTANGKYVIVREYNTSPKAINDNDGSELLDFKVRENVVIVDREDIVSAPETTSTGEIRSIVGSDIFINVLDGEENAKQFSNIYAARNNDSYILQTNKLPVSVYIPISKYGQSTPSDKFYYNTDNLFDYYLHTIQDDNISTYDILERYNYYNISTESEVLVKSKLKLIYFGNNAVTISDFQDKSNIFKNHSFDLSVKITTSDGTIIATTTAFNFNTIVKSARLTSYGIYYVEITQNQDYGKIYPNVFKTFKFSFEIIEQPPEFKFIDANDDTNSQVCKTDINGVSYTNLDAVKVVWTDPNNTDFLAKIDATDNGYGYAKGIKYNINGTEVRVKVSRANNSALSNKTEYNQIFTSDDGKTHWFFIDISNVNRNPIITVEMQYEGKVIIEGLTSIKKELYVDRQAPLTVVDELIAKTKINGINLASYSRKYVNADGATVLNDNRYNTPVSSEYFPLDSTTNHPLAYYSFIVKNNLSKLSQLLTTKIPSGSNKYYVDGFNYYIKLIPDINNYTITTIDSAKNATVTHNVDIVNLVNNNNAYYEVVESDLAGNISIYIIYVVGDDIGSTVLEYDKEDTDYNTTKVLYYEDLKENQDIFVKTYFKISKLDLYNYDFLEFQVDNVSYFKSKTINNYVESLGLNVNDNYVYNLTAWSDTDESLPPIVKLSDIFNFTEPKKHTIVLIDPTKEKTEYTINIYVNNKDLDCALFQTGEGINIVGNAPLNNVLLYPQDIQIYSYENSRYNLIYSDTYSPLNPNFIGNTLVKYTKTENTYSFRILAPVYAYKYVFTDNYGVSYVQYHTTNDIELSKDQKVQKFLEKVTITDLIDGRTDSNDWYVGTSSIIYNYSATEYTAYVKVYTPIILIGNTEVTWRLFEGYTKNTMTRGLDGTLYGYELARPTTRIGVNVDGLEPEIYCICTKNSSYETINQITFYNPLSNLMDGYNGSVIKFEITLVSTKEQSSTNNIIERFVINNMIPNINLKDKNDNTQNTLFEGSVLFTGQLSVELPDSKVKDNYLFPYYITLTRKGHDPIKLINGYVVTEPDTYTINTSIVLNNVHYLILSKAFVISESSNEFYRVSVKNTGSQIYETVNPTNKTFTYKNVIYTKHYIVNSTDIDISVNSNQGIKEAVLDTTLSSNTTFIYHISNYDSELGTNVSPFKIDIAISYIPSTTMILSESKFKIIEPKKTDDLFDGNEKGSYIDVIIDNENNQMDYITVRFNAFYNIRENEIHPIIYYGENESVVFSPVINYESDDTKSFKISTSGVYNLKFVDQAGNTQIFTDVNNLYTTEFFTITFIKGVAYLINGSQPIQNGIYNDKVEITLPTILKNMYNIGGEPKIHVLKNGKEITLRPNQEGIYILDEAGYYKVYFEAEAKGHKLREESYNFLILASNEYRSSFEFSEYADYEVIEVIKNGQVKNYANYFESNPETKGLKNILISLYDEKTGEGNYQLTIATNSDILNETFTFSFIIKHIGVIPIIISINEGETTKDAINIEFNAYDLYTEIGECKLTYGTTTILINQEYLDSIGASTYYQNLSITRAGTYFIQVYTSSDKLLYSYKVIKKDPLNAISIIIIVVAVLAGAGLTVTIILLRKKMKIK